MLMVLSALTVHLEFRVLLAKCECDGDKLVLVVAGAVIARHNNTCITNFHLGPCILSNSVDTEYITASI